MQNQKSLLTDEVISAIIEILKCGNRAEIKLIRSDVEVVEVNRQVIIKPNINSQRNESR